MTLLKKIQWMLVLGAAASVPYGCAESTEGLPPDAATGKDTPVTVSMTLTLTTTQGSSTRDTGPRSYGHPQEEASEQECRIDFDNKDFLIMAFDTGTRRLLQIIDASSIRGFNRPDGSLSYRLIATLNAPYTDFTIVVLANWASLGINYEDLNAIAGSTFIDDLLVKARQLPFTLNPGRWRPFENSYGGIPMFGMRAYSITSGQWAASSEATPVILERPVPMLRALAKIEVVDRINPQDGGNRAKVSAAILNRYNKYGCAMPDTGKNPSWDLDGTGVSEPTLPENPGYSESAGIPMFEDTPLAIGGKEYPRYSAYVSEFHYGQLTDRQSSPYLSLTVANTDTDFGSYDKELTYTLKLATYTGGQPDRELDFLLRNHIYRFEIRSVTSTIVNMYYTVCPWDTADIELPVYPE